MEIVLILIIAALMMFIGIEHDPNFKGHFPKSTENEPEKAEKNT
jgi:hypothetical protein